jgi:hypothetical protein
MKSKIVIIALFIIGGYLPAFSQQDTTQSTDEIKIIFSQKKGSNGGYASIWTGYTQIDNKDAFAFGINAAYLIGHSVGIGIAGTGFTNDFYIGHEEGTNYKSLMGGYGGLFIEPIIFPKFPIHVSFPVVLGAGGIAAMNAYYWGDWDSEYYLEESEFFMVAEPGIDIELNMLKHLRLGLGAKYRFTSHLNLENYSKSLLDGLTVNFSVKFGKF